MGQITAASPLSTCGGGTGTSRLSIPEVVGCELCCPHWHLELPVCLGGVRRAIFGVCELSL